jgi:hypothetical protein
MSTSNEPIRFVYVVDGKATLNYAVPDPSQMPTPTNEGEQLTIESYENMILTYRSNPIIIEWIEPVPPGSVWNGSYFEVPQPEE